MRFFVVAMVLLPFGNSFVDALALLLLLLLLPLLDDDDDADFRLLDFLLVDAAIIVLILWPFLLALLPHPVTGIVDVYILGAAMRMLLLARLRHDSVYFVSISAHIVFIIAIAAITGGHQLRLIRFVPWRRVTNY